MLVRRSGRRCGGEDGYTLVITAVSIVIMLGFSAIAVDLGSVYNLRRQDQSAADVAALGAAQDLGEDAAAVQRAIGLAESSLDRPLGASAYNSCAGEVLSGESAGMTKSATANCVSFDSLRHRVRVRVPLQETGSTFGSIVGVDTYEHSAYAVAELYREGFGGVLPFGITSNAGTYECIKAGASNVPSDRCSTNYSGNFGFVNLGFHGNAELGTSADCAGQGQNRLGNNIAAGIDHNLSRFATWSGTDWTYHAPHYGTRVIDTSSPCGETPRPNSLLTLTGNVPDETGNGLFSGSNFTDGQPARLQRTHAELSTMTTAVSGYALDDRPLWDFIPDSLSGADVPRSCWRDQFIGHTGGLNTDNDLLMTALPDSVAAHLISMPVEERTNRLLQRCFVHYVGDDWDDNGAFDPPEPPVGCTGTCSDPVFSRNSSTSDEPDLWDIQYTPRFGYVPQMTGTWPSGTSGTIDIDRFRPIFLQRLFAGNCDPQGCDSQFDPGVGYTDSNSSTKAAAITAFVFPNTMLPGDLGGENAPNDIGVNVFVRLVR